jgi:hypothetical protein
MSGDAMITIIRRESLDHFQSLQFLVLLGVSIILFFANGLIFVKNYRQQLTWYNQRVAETYQNPSTVATRLFVRPNPLSFLSEGGDKYRPTGYDLKPKGVMWPLPAEPRNFKLPDIPELDWAFIIRTDLFVHLRLFELAGFLDDSPIFARPAGVVGMLGAFRHYHSQCLRDFI